MAILSQQEIIHKIKSPLTAILGYVELIYRSNVKSSNDPNIQVLLKKLKKSTFEVKTLIEELEDKLTLPRK
jgi:signal transduction histidine kinase